MLRILILTITLIASASCVGTKTGAYEAFTEDLERLSGTDLNEAYIYNIGYLSKLKPDTVQELPNGHEIRTYSVKPPRTQNCKVHVEITKNDIIVVATSEGEECWRAY